MGVVLVDSFGKLNDLRTTLPFGVDNSLYVFKSNLSKSKIKYSF